MGDSYFQENGSGPSCPDGYVLMEEIGRGGFGTVYKAIQVHTGLTVAVKILHHNAMTGYSRDRAAAAFEREAMILACLDHPGIVRLLHHDRQTGSMIFEYVSGITLKSFLLQKHILPPVEAGLLMARVLEALVYAHGKGIVHLDLKPQNIMVTTPDDGLQVKVLDFGIASFLPDSQSAALAVSQNNAGTPFYTAPEHLHGTRISVAADLYSWGLILLECLTGRVRQRTEDACVALQAALADHALGVLLQKVLCKDPASRKADTAQLWQEYRAIDFSTVVPVLPAAGASCFPPDEEITRINPVS